MQITDLDYTYPAELVATEPSRPTRVALIQGGEPRELDLQGLLEQFKTGDLLVINESKVIPARVFSKEEVEILFLKAVSERDWQVLFPAREFRANDQLALPGDLIATLVQKGLPQVVHLSRSIDHTYFEKYGEVALPPYIQEARGERHNRASDFASYQPAWAKIPGSVASPTASLHFTEDHLQNLRGRGVEVASLTLHVGAGTFLPIRAQNLDEHHMHAEQVEIPFETLQKIEATRVRGGRIWALGTTVARSLEAWAEGDLQQQPDGSAAGETKIFIKPPYQFKVVSGLLTNFHQPRSTLLSLVAAFAGLDNVKRSYAWAVEQRFRLFSYGDLSAWIR